MKGILRCVAMLIIPVIACSDDERERHQDGMEPKSLTRKQFEAESSRVYVKITFDTPPVGVRKDICLFFSGGFDKDSVVVKQGSSSLYHGVLTTDNRVAYAGGMKLSRQYKEIDFVVNGNAAQVEVPSGFTYCRVDKLSDTLLLYFTNVEPQFR